MYKFKHFDIKHIVHTAINYMIYYTRVKQK